MNRIHLIHESRSRCAEFRILIFVMIKYLSHHINKTKQNLDLVNIVMTNNAGPFWNVQLEAYPLSYKIYPVQVLSLTFSLS